MVINPASDKSLTVTYTGTAGTTGAFPPGATGVYLFATTTAYVKINGTATTDDFPLAANFPVILRLNDMNSFTVSAIQHAAGGSLLACPVIGATI